jgi:hypothetical protein
MSGWDALNAAITEARALIAAEAPDPEIAAEGEAYVARVVTAALSSAVMGHRHMQGGLATALPVYGGPNPDYIMRHTVVDPGGRYRLEGRLNGSERVGVGLYTIGCNGAPLIAGYTAFDGSNCGPDGEFSLDIAADAQGPGTLAAPPGARILMFRVLHRDTSQPAQLELAGGAPQRGPTLVAGSSDGALTHVANTVRSNITEYLKWMVAARNLANRLDEAPPELADTVVGDAGTQYFLGGFDLGAGEWLEVTLPAGLSGYWSLHAYNFWYEHLVTPGVHDRNAIAGEDGFIRIAVGPELPADAVNRIDTLGRRRGAFVCRIAGHGMKIQAPGTHVHSPR